MARVTTSADLRLLPLELDTPSGDSRHIEQVIDQAIEVPDLPFDDDPLALAPDVAAQLHQL